MKRRCICLALMACLCAGSTLTVCAEDYTVGSGFATWCADGKMSSNFEASEITEAILEETVSPSGLRWRIGRRAIQTGI